MRLRVLHCIYDDVGNPWVGGGGAVRVHELYRRLADRVEVVVATGRYPGARDEAIDSVSYLRLGASGPYAWSRATYVARAQRLLQSFRYDAAVVDFSVYTPLVPPRRRPIGVTVHHLTGDTAAARFGRVGGGLITRAERWMLRRARRLSATSDATLAALRAHVGAPIEKVGAGVAESFFALERREADRLLCFGRLDLHQKGLDLALEAFALLAPEWPGLTLCIAGRGRDRAPLMERAQRLGIAGRVELLGAVDTETQARLLSSAKVQLMPSRFEGFGIAAAEAMAAGVPLVATTVGALPEVVGNGGVLIPPESPVALADAVRGLLRSPEARRQLSLRAREAASRFGWARVADAHHGFLTRIAG